MSREREKLAAQMAGLQVILDLAQECSDIAVCQQIANVARGALSGRAAETKSPTEADNRRLERRNRIQQERGVLPPPNGSAATEQYRAGWEAGQQDSIGACQRRADAYASAFPGIGDITVHEALQCVAAIRALEPSSPPHSEACSLEHDKVTAAKCNSEGHPLIIHRCVCGVRQKCEPQPPVVEQKEKA